MDRIKLLEDIVEAVASQRAEIAEAIVNRDMDGSTAYCRIALRHLRENHPEVNVLENYLTDAENLMQTLIGFFRMEESTIGRRREISVQITQLTEELKQLQDH